MLSQFYLSIWNIYLKFCKKKKKFCHIEKESAMCLKKSSKNISKPDGKKSINAITFGLVLRKKVSGDIS